MLKMNTPQADRPPCSMQYPNKGRSRGVIASLDSRNYGELSQQTGRGVGLHGFAIFSVASHRLVEQQPHAALGI